MSSWPWRLWHRHRPWTACSGSTNPNRGKWITTCSPWTWRRRATTGASRTMGSPSTMLRSSTPCAAESLRWRWKSRATTSHASIRPDWCCASTKRTTLRLVSSMSMENTTWVPWSPTTPATGASSSSTAPCPSSG